MNILILVSLAILLLGYVKKFIKGYKITDADTWPNFLVISCLIPVEVIIRGHYNWDQICLWLFYISLVFLGFYIISNPVATKKIYRSQKKSGSSGSDTEITSLCVLMFIATKNLTIFFKASLDRQFDHGFIVATLVSCIITVLACRYLLRHWMPSKIEILYFLGFSSLIISELILKIPMQDKLMMYFVNLNLLSFCSGLTVPLLYGAVAGKSRINALHKDYFATLAIFILFSQMVSFYFIFLLKDDSIYLFAAIFFGCLHYFNKLKLKNKKYRSV